MSRFLPDDDRGGTPQPGYFKLRMVPGGPLLPARIRLLPAQTWQAVINGEAQGPPTSDSLQAKYVWRIWHGGERCSPAEYFRLLALKAWADRFHPDHPICHPLLPVDLRNLPPIVPQPQTPRVSAGPQASGGSPGASRSDSSSESGNAT